MDEQPSSGSPSRPRDRNAVEGYSEDRPGTGEIERLQRLVALDVKESLCFSTLFSARQRSLMVDWDFSVLLLDGLEDEVEVFVLKENGVGIFKTSS